MGQAVEECAGESLGAEDPGPFVEGEIAGNQDGALFVALAEDLEQQFGADFGERDKAEFIDDQQAIGSAVYA